MVSIYKTQEGRESIERFYKAVLQRWPVPNRQIVLPTCEGETFVVASGEDYEAAVVLFHGAGTNSGAWFRDVTEWSARFRVYAVDMIGEPGLSAPSRPPLSSDRYARWLDSDHMTRVFQEFRPRRERIPTRTDAELAALKMPVQLILGGKDAMLRSHETRDRATRLIPRLQLEYLEHEGHFLPRQTDRIAGFLDSTANARASGGVDQLDQNLAAVS